MTDPLTYLLRGDTRTRTDRFNQAPMGEGSPDLRVTHLRLVPPVAQNPHTLGTGEHLSEFCIDVQLVGEQQVLRLRGGPLCAHDRHRFPHRNSFGLLYCWSLSLVSPYMTVTGLVKSFSSHLPQARHRQRVPCVGGGPVNLLLLRRWSQCSDVERVGLDPNAVVPLRYLPPTPT